MLVLVPVRGGPLDGFFDLGPGLEATPFEGQRAQDLPPRLDQVQVGRVFGLKHELPARVGQSKEQHIGCAVDVEVVHHGVDPRDIGVDPALDLAEEIDPVCGGAAGVRGGERLPCSRSEGTEDIALAATAVVDLLLGPLCFGTGRLDHAPAGVAPGRLRPHLVEADDYAALWRGGIEALEHPLIWALKSSVTSSPDALSRCKRVVDRSWICPRLSPLALMRSTAPHHLISGRDRVPDQHPACNGNGLRGGRDQSFERHGRARGRNAVTRPPRTSPRGRAMCRWSRDPVRSSLQPRPARGRSLRISRSRPAAYGGPRRAIYWAPSMAGSQKA